MPPDPQPPRIEDLTPAQQRVIRTLLRIAEQHQVKVDEAALVEVAHGLAEAREDLIAEHDA